MNARTAETPSHDDDRQTELAWLAGLLDARRVTVGRRHTKLALPPLGRDPAGLSARVERLWRSTRLPYPHVADVRREEDGALVLRGGAAVARLLREAAPWRTT